MADELAFRRLRDANPILDPAEQDHERLEAPVFLAAIKQRSAEMKTEYERTTTDEASDQSPTNLEVIATEEDTRRPRIGVLVGVAFTLILLVAGSIVLLNRDSKSDVAADDSVPTTIAEPAAAGTRVGGAVTFDVLVFEANSGDFTTVSDADICSEGTIRNVNFNKTATVWTFEDRYTCADESGSFILLGDFGELDPEVQSPATLDGTWTIAEGTGRFVGLEGSGTVAAKFAPLWRETYTGELNYGPEDG